MTNIATNHTEPLRSCNQADAIVYAEKGVAHFKSGHYDAARDNFETALRLDPNLAYAYCARGALRGKLKQFDLAIQDFNRAIKLDQNYADAISNRGIALALLEQNTFALADFTTAIQLHPTTSLYVNRAHVLRALKFTELAINDCVTAITMDERNSEAYFLLFDLNLDREDYCAAIECLTLLIQTEPTLARAYYHRAYAHSKNKNEANALKDLVEAARLNLRYQSMLENVLSSSMNNDFEPAQKAWVPMPIIVQTEFHPVGISQ